MSPEFPIRVITDDGACEVIDSPDELMRRVESRDSRSRKPIWVGTPDRTVLIRMRGGMVEVLEVETGNQ